MSEFDTKYDIVDEKPPRHTLMSGHYKQSFAYYTLRERLPVILTTIVDNLTKEKDELAEQHGEMARDEIKYIVGQLSKLKYQLQTDKPLEKISLAEADGEMWNAFIDALDPEKNTYFKTCWLYAECYMYRRVRSIFEDVFLLRFYDYFRKQKENALQNCTDALIDTIKSSQRPKGELEEEDRMKFFVNFLKLALWGNRCDLSISEGKEIRQTGDLFTSLASLDEFILDDNTKDVWRCVAEDYEGERIIDVVQDNAGFELFTDLLLVDYILEQKLATRVRFHVKAMPWFVSDVNPSDFRWSLNHLSQVNSKHLQDLALRFYEYLNESKVQIIENEFFWTSPYEFYRMKEINPTLYETLSEAHLVIFKGDLNYRKLLGDYTWESTEEFKTCLREFEPTNICTVRTIKADLICGLKDGQLDELDKREDDDWMTTGKYGLIQFARKLN